MFHYGPAHLLDIFLRILGKKPFLVKISSLMQKSTAALETFTTNSWEWSHANMDKLWAELSEEDRQLFHFDIRDLIWRQYLETYVKVLYLYLYQHNVVRSAQYRKQCGLTYVHTLSHM